MFQIQFQQTKPSCKLVNHKDKIENAWNNNFWSKNKPISIERQKVVDAETQN